MISINMSSNKSFPLLILSSLLLSLIFDSAALTALKSCPSDCGGIEIPYPFGIGKGCYLEKWYEINCTSVSGKLVPFLSIVSKEVVKISLPGEFSWGSAPLSYGSVRIKNPITSKGCSSDDDEQESRSLLNLTGSPFYVGYGNTLIAIGCDNMASLTHVEPSMVGCISSCVATNRTTTSSKDYLALVDCNSKKNYEYCSQRSFKNETICSNGTGCCMANMPGSIQQVFGVRIATTGGEGCKVAFLTDEAYSLLNETDLNGTDPKQFHAKGYATVELGWFIHTTNPSFIKSLRCTTMKEYRSLYVKSYEKAHRINCSCDYDSYFPNHASCRCNKGYTGNSYLPGGCKDINECLQKDVDGNLWRCKGGKCVNLQGTYNCVHKNRRPLAATGVGSSLGSLIAAGGIYGLYKFISEGRRLHQKKKFFKRNGGLLLQQQLSSTEGNDETTRVFDSSELEKATENFNSNRILGRRGNVYKGMLVDGRIVAAKKSKVVEKDKVEEFINEVVNLSKIKHRNIAKLLGCCLETDVPVLVNEFTPNGNLFELLHDEFDDNTMATWEVRLSIAVDVAGALSYLHSSTPSPIYHRDIKSENIMLDEKYRAKVSDFGILTVDHTDLTTVVSDTDGYMDPEYLQSKQYTDKSDVYSFGVVLAELITGEESISCLRSKENMKLATYFILAMKENRVSNIIDARIRDGCKLNQVIAVAKIARKCLNLKGRNRPSMREVSMQLEKIRSSPGDMQPPEDDVGENEDERDEGVVDGNIGEGSRKKAIVTAPASQYIVDATSSSWFDV